MGETKDDCNSTLVIEESQKKLLMMPRLNILHETIAYVFEGCKL
jgi:hypothetical protein